MRLHVCVCACEGRKEREGGKKERRGVERQTDRQTLCTTLFLGDLY